MASFCQAGVFTRCLYCCVFHCCMARCCNGFCFLSGTAFSCTFISLYSIFCTRSSYCNRPGIPLMSECFSGLLCYQHFSAYAAMASFCQAGVFTGRLYRCIFHCCMAGCCNGFCLLSSTAISGAFVRFYSVFRTGGCCCDSSTIPCMSKRISGFLCNQHFSTHAAMASFCQAGFFTRCLYCCIFHCCMARCRNFFGSRSSTVVTRTMVCFFAFSGTGRFFRDSAFVPHMLQRRNCFRNFRSTAYTSICNNSLICACRLLSSRFFPCMLFTLCHRHIKRYGIIMPSILISRCVYCTGNRIIVRYAIIYRFSTQLWIQLHGQPI